MAVDLSLAIIHKGQHGRAGALVEEPVTNRAFVGMFPRTALKTDENLGGSRPPHPVGAADERSTLAILINSDRMRSMISIGTEKLVQAADIAHQRRAMVILNLRDRNPPSKAKATCGHPSMAAMPMFEVG